MRNTISSTIILIILVLFGVNANSHDVSAKQKDPLDLVKKASYVHAPDCGNHDNPYGATLFTVTFQWGNGCNSSICDEINGTFHCVDPGDSCTTGSHVHNGSISVTSGSCPGSVSSAIWDCYDVSLPADGDYQDIMGKIKRLKEFDLTVISIDQSGNRLDNVTGLAPKTTTVFYGNTASLSRGQTYTGYTFIGWSDGYSGGNVYRRVMVDDYVVYAVYRGESNSSSTNITVKNNNVSKYNREGQKIVYAKPGSINNPIGDKLTYNASYSPGTQNGVNWHPQLVEIGKNGNWSNPCGGNNTTQTLNELFNRCRNGNNNWNNAFSVTKQHFKSDSSPLDYMGVIGRTSTMSRANSHNVLPQEVGSALIENAVTNRVWTTQSTPKSYVIGLTNGLSSGKVDLTNLNSTATAYIPYNFENDSEKPKKPEDKPNDNPGDDGNDPKDSEGNQKVVYAGEKDTFEFNINVEPRYNPETDGTYATIVNNAKWRLGLCIGNACNSNSYNYSATKTGNLNESFNLNGQKGIRKELDINIPDLAAGSRICVVAEVFPKTSGAYTNWEDVEYKGQSWARSPKSCYIVAKRPSFQIWAGNIYSQSSINTSLSIKNNLAGYSNFPYVAEVKSNQYSLVFGSWGELGVIGNDLISGFGSGASMGYGGNAGGLSPNPFSNNNASSAPNPGGSRTTNYCELVPLTIPNSNCSRNIAGNLNIAVGVTNATSDKQLIIDLLASGENTANHTHYDGSATVGKSNIGGSIDGSTTKVVSAGGDIIISENLDYFEGGTYTNYSQMPKLIIYSKNNIYINCNVTRIDALLIADDTVVTCNNFDNNLTEDNIKKHLNDAQNSNQLIVNGAIIAKRLIPNRTYGAATGANSIVPAEIVNFDPTLYQFGGSAEADNDTTGRLDVTYMHEVAPRL